MIDPSVRPLYGTLQERRRPEDVAQMILEIQKGDLSSRERSLLEKAARGSLKRKLWGYTSMLQSFARPVGAEQQVAKAAELFAEVPPLPDDKCDDPQEVEAFIRHISPQIAKTFGVSNFREDRLNHVARHEAGLDLSRRQYNKRFRLLQRLEQKLQVLLREAKKFHLTRIGKSGLATEIVWEEFGTDRDTACFIAYLTARSNLRSEFTIDGQERPFDEIAKMLLERATQSSTVNWWAIAHVFPQPEILIHLSEEQKGNLLGRWYAVLQEVAELLGDIFTRSRIDRETMVVRPGNDSTTWNNIANAWNQARKHWITLLYDLRMEEVLDTICPGKALRLMAADVVAWQFQAGKGLHPDVAVWRELPLPWEVVTGNASCNRMQIEAVCRRHEIDPASSGWSAPPPPPRAVPFRPTPELVHGITVGHPYLAKLLRDAGYFSGKVKPFRI